MKSLNYFVQVSVLSIALMFGVAGEATTGIEFDPLPTVVPLAPGESPPPITRTIAARTPFRLLTDATCARIRANFTYDAAFAGQLVEAFNSSSFFMRETAKTCANYLLTTEHGQDLVNRMRLARDGGGLTLETRRRIELLLNEAGSVVDCTLNWMSVRVNGSGADFPQPLIVRSCASMDNAAALHEYTLGDGDPAAIAPNIRAALFQTLFDTPQTRDTISRTFPGIPDVLFLGSPTRARPRSISCTRRAQSCRRGSPGPSFPQRSYRCSYSCVCRGTGALLDHYEAEATLPASVAPVAHMDGFAVTQICPAVCPTGRSVESHSSRLCTPNGSQTTTSDTYTVSARLVERLLPPPTGRPHAGNSAPAPQGH